MILLSQAHQSARLLATRIFIDDGASAPKLRIFDGQRPADPQSAETGTLLVELPIQRNGSVVNGTLTLSPVAPQMVVASGTPKWARLINGDGVPVMDLDAGGPASSAEVRVSDGSIFLGGQVSLTSITLT